MDIMEILNQAINHGTIPFLVRQTLRRVLRAQRRD